MPPADDPVQEQELDHGPGERLRLPWSRSDRRLPRLVIRPLQEFFQTEAAGGILLLLAAAVALVWANSPWSDSYENLWATDLTLRLGPWSITEDLQSWINDALMAIFFFVVGMEIKRELVSGELRELRRAALPAFGALGGMVIPAVLFTAINVGTPGARGWGIPMATDIAFAVGIVAILGRRLPSPVKVFLLALAIVDDIGAILVIAIFYSEGISWSALASAVGLVATIVVLQRAQVRHTAVYVILGAGVWLAVFESGVHATIAGVVLGLLTPATPFQPSGAVSEQARYVARSTSEEEEAADGDAHHWLGLASLSREAVSPLDRFEHGLHPWTSYLIVPLFALANAGVDLGGGVIGDALTSRLTLGIVVGLVVGKVVGITAVSWAATRLGLAQLPHGTRWPQIVAVAAVAGIGFTVSLFIADLGFSDPVLLDQAKVGVLGASLLAGILGGVLLRIVGRESAPF